MLELILSKMSSTRLIVIFTDSNSMSSSNLNETQHDEKAFGREYEHAGDSIWIYLNKATNLCKMILAKGDLHNTTISTDCIVKQL